MPLVNGRTDGRDFYLNFNGIEERERERERDNFFVKTPTRIYGLQIKEENSLSLSGPSSLSLSLSLAIFSPSFHPRFPLAKKNRDEKRKGERVFLHFPPI